MNKSKNIILNNYSRIIFYKCQTKNDTILIRVKNILDCNQFPTKSYHDEINMFYLCAFK